MRVVGSDVAVVMAAGGGGGEWRVGSSSSFPSLHGGLDVLVNMLVKFQQVSFNFSQSPVLASGFFFKKKKLFLTEECSVKLEDRWLLDCLY